MPSKRKTASTGKREQQRLFQIGDQWLVQEEGRSTYYRAWYCRERKRVRRRRLGTDDFEEAKRLLAQIVLGEAPDDPEAPDQVLLASVLTFYLDGHARNIRSKNQARRACELCIEYMQTATRKKGPTVADLTLSRQHSFMRWLADKGLSAKTISTYLATIKSATNYAVTPRMVVDSQGREREARMLSQPHYIVTGQDEVCKITGLSPSKPRDFLPSVGQMGAFLDAIRGDGLNDTRTDQNHIFRYMILALNTWARPEAIFDLDVSQQVSFETGLIDLLPPGKAQQKNKRRPIIRLTDNLRGWLLYWDEAKPIRRGGVPVGYINQKTVKKIARQVGMPAFVPYSVRHFMATRVRRVPGFQVTREERAQWLGHVDKGHRQTEWYERHDPDFLENAAAATDAIMAELDSYCEKSLFAPGSVKGSRMTVIESYRVASDGENVANGEG